MLQNLDELIKKAKELADEIDNLKKDKNTLEKKLELLQIEKDKLLAVSEANCQQKISALEVRMSKDFELKEENYKKTIEDLEKQLKEKEIVVEKPEVHPKSFREWLVKVITLWPK